MFLNSHLVIHIPAVIVSSSCDWKNQRQVFSRFQIKSSTKLLKYVLVPYLHCYCMSFTPGLLSEIEVIVNSNVIFKAAPSLFPERCQMDWCWGSKVTTKSILALKGK